VILQLVTRFHRETIDASGVGQQVELQGVFVATTFGDAAQVFSGDNDRRLAAKFDYVLDRVGAPRAQCRDYSISILTIAYRHRLRNP